MCGDISQIDYEWIEEIRNGRIGEPQRHIEIEPLEEPASEPVHEPAAPERAPAAPERQPEEVPA